MSRVRIKVLQSLAESLGIEATSEELISDPKNEGGHTVKELLNRLGERYPRIGRTVFNLQTQRLTGQVMIFLNGRSLDLVDGLDTKLSSGDTLTFVPHIEGG